MKARPLIGYKVKLIPFEDKYAEAIHAWYYDVRYAAFFRFFDDHALAIDDFRNWGKIMADGGVGLFVVLDRATGKPVGLMTYVCLKRKSGVYRFGIMLDAGAQHQVMAIESIMILADYLFTYEGCQKLVIEFLEDDEHIKRIAEKGGFVFESRLAHEAIHHGRVVHELRYYYMKDKAYEVYGSYYDGLRKLPENSS